MEEEALNFVDILLFQSATISANAANHSLSICASFSSI